MTPTLIGTLVGFIFGAIIGFIFGFLARSDEQDKNGRR